jgi:hypothetical protein
VIALRGPGAPRMVEGFTEGETAEPAVAQPWLLCAAAAAAPQEPIFDRGPTQLALTNEALACWRQAAMKYRPGAEEQAPRRSLTCAPSALGPLAQCVPHRWLNPSLEAIISRLRATIWPYFGPCGRTWMKPGSGEAVVDCNQPSSECARNT